MMRKLTDLEKRRLLAEIPGCTLKEFACNADGTDYTWFRYDVSPEGTEKENWSLMVEFQEKLRGVGFEIKDPQVEHDCISGDLVRYTRPYTQKELERDERFRVQVWLADGRWVEVETTTQFICNGMLNQIKHLIERGNYTVISKPDEIAETFFYVNEEDFGFNAIGRYPLINRI